VETIKRQTRLFGRRSESVGAGFDSSL